MRRPRVAFSLVELLVVIGILAILMGLLIPAVAKARNNARQATCATRLRSLSAACALYLQDYSAYPAPAHIPVQGAVIPHFVPVSLLNQLSSYVGSDRMPDSMTIDQVPEALKCPMRAEYELPSIHQAMPLPGSPVIMTGYQYTVGVDRTTSGQAMILRPDRVTDVRGRRRGVLWSDTLGWYSGTGLVFLPPGLPGQWAYFHFRSGRVPFNGFGAGDTSAMLGQHRAWSDGSVEWIAAHQMQLGLDQKDSTATYKFGRAGDYFGYFWF